MGYEIINFAATIEQQAATNSVLKNLKATSGNKLGLCCNKKNAQFFCNILFKRVLNILLLVLPCVPAYMYPILRILKK